MSWAVVYLSVRTVVWLLAASFLAIKMGNATQVHRTHIAYLITGITGVFAIRDLCELVGIGGPSPFDYVIRFLSKVAEAGLLALLLFISGGYGITLSKLRELPQYCFVLPSVYFVAGVVFQCLLQYTKSATDASQISDWEVYVALFSGLGQAIIVVMSWMSVLESSENVAKSLEQMAPRTAQERETAANTFQLSPDEEFNDGFQVVQPEVTTVAEEVDRMSKADLMRKFKIAVTVYLFALVSAFFIPVWDSNGNDTNVALIIVLCWNTIQLTLLLALAWVFRPREKENPYIFVGEDESSNVHLETAMNIEMSMGTSMPAIQEMPDEDALESAQASPTRSGNTRNKATDAVPDPGDTHSGSPNGKDIKATRVAAVSPKAGKFSLGDDEDAKLE